MIFDGISLTEGTAISNASIASGTAFPSNANAGELFYRTDLESLHVYNGSAWAEVGSGSGSGPASTTDLPEGSNLYFTTARARNAISLTAGSSGATYDNVSGVLNLSALTSGSSASGGSGSVQFSNGSGVFTSGNLVFTVGSNTLTIGTTNGTGFLRGAESGSSTIAGSIQLLGGQNTSTGQAGNITLQGGYAQANAAGTVIIAGGERATGGNGGDILFRTYAPGVTERFRILANGAWSVGSAGSNTGTSGQVLTSNGSSAAPTWQTNSSVQTNQSNTFTKAQIVTPVALTSAATITVDASLSNNFKLTMTVSGQLANPTNLVDGQVINIRVAQDGTGGRSLTFGSMYKFAGGDVPANTLVPGAVDYLTCVYDAELGILLCSFARAFA